MWSGSSWVSDRAGLALAIASLAIAQSAGAAGAVESPAIAGPVASPIGDASASNAVPILSWLPPHEPWIAAGLSLGVNGLGQVYNGDWDRAWWAIAPALAYPVAWGVDALTGSNVARTATVVWWTGAKAWSSWDAYHEAERRK